MLKPLLVWIVTFGLSAMLARGAARCVAFQVTMPFPSYDDEAIYDRIKRRVFTRTWLLCTIVSSTLVAGSMLSDDTTMILLSGSGIILITTYTAARGYKLFRLALSEMNLPWPPLSRD